MTDITQLINVLGDTPLAHALVLILVAVIILRLALPLVFGFRTHIMSALESTYNEHIEQLKEYIEELKTIIESERSEKQGLKDEVTGLTTEVKGVKRQLSLVIAYLKAYGCSKAPDCKDAEPVDFDMCDGCTDDCDGCAFGNYA